MNKRGRWFYWALAVVLLLVLVGLMFAYFAFFGGKNYDSVYQQRIDAGQLVNPIGQLSDEQAVMQFNESFVYYLLYTIGAYNLHNAPLSSENPQIEFVIGEDSYNANIVGGEIFVSKGVVNSEDVIIRTTKQEAVMMIKDRNYVVQSFNDGKSSMDLIASKSTLLGKGYLGIYEKLTGKGITGNVVGFYSN